MNEINSALRRTGVIPFGFIQCPDNPHRMIPVQAHLDLLERVLDHLDQRAMSYREAAHWLREQTGRRIDYVSLYHRHQLRKARQEGAQAAVAAARAA